MSSRTLSQRDNVKHMRRLFQILKNGGLEKYLCSWRCQWRRMLEFRVRRWKPIIWATRNQTRVGFIGMFKRIDSKIEFWFFAKGGKEGRMAGKCHNWYGGQNLFQWISEHQPYLQKHYSRQKDGNLYGWRMLWSSLRNDSLAAERIFLPTWLKQRTDLRNELLNARKPL